MKSLLFVLSLLLFQPTTAVAQGSLILLVDVSSSIDIVNLELQYKSYAQVLREVRHIQDINVEVVLFDDNQRLISSGTAQDAATAFENEPLLAPEHRGLTCVHEALLFIEPMIASLPQPVIVDISGDGLPTCGTEVGIYDTLARLENMGVTINTLYIETEPVHGVMTDDIRLGAYKYFESLTINHGFSLQAKSWMDFEVALFEKMVREVSEMKVLEFHSLTGKAHN